MKIKSWRACDNCGEIFSVWFWQQRDYCSTKCLHEAIKREQAKVDAILRGEEEHRTDSDL